MADGDYTMPVYPGVVGVGGNNCAPGLQGKDASFLSELHTLDGHRDLTETVSKNSKEDAIQVVEAKFEAAKNQKDTEVRMERIARETLESQHSMRRELERHVRDEADKTRDLIRDMDEKRRADAYQAKTDLTLASIIAKLDILLP